MSRSGRQACHGGEGTCHLLPRRLDGAHYRLMSVSSPQRWKGWLCSLSRSHLRARDTAQLVEDLSGMHKALGPTPTYTGYGGSRL